MPKTDRDENGLNEADRRLDAALDRAFEGAGIPPGIDVAISMVKSEWPESPGFKVEKVVPSFPSTPTHGHVFHDLYQEAVIAFGKPILKMVKPNKASKPLEPLQKALPGSAPSKVTQGKIKALQRRLVPLYAEMAALTHGDCFNPTLIQAPYQCRCSMRAGSCCERVYCLEAMAVAGIWGETLIETGNGTLPFLGADGKCTVPPHLRPTCTVHTCDISSLGFHKTNRAWTEQYFKLRNQIDELERRLYLLRRA